MNFLRLRYRKMQKYVLESGQGPLRIGEAEGRRANDRALTRSIWLAVSGGRYAYD